MQSAYGMPEFEDITSINPNVNSNIKYHNVNTSTNTTGARVEQYVKLVLVSHKMKMLRCIIPFWCTKLQLQNEDHYELMIDLRVVDYLKPLNKSSMVDLLSGWIIKGGDSFQPNCTHIWRNGGNITVVSDLIPQIRLYE